MTHLPRLVTVPLVLVWMLPIVSAASLVLRSGSDNASSPLPPPTTYEAWLAEFCGRWSHLSLEADGVYAQLFDRAIALAGSPATGDFPLRVLADPHKAECWRVSSDVIGFAGDAQVVERLLRHFETVRLADLSIGSPEEATLLPVLLARAYSGIAFAVTRFNESHGLSLRIERFLADTLRADFWLSGGRLPKLDPRWFAPLPESEARQILANETVSHAITSFGYCGSKGAASSLLTFNESVRSDPYWASKMSNGVVRIVANSLTTNDLIRDMGLKAYLAQFGARPPWH